MFTEAICDVGVRLLVLLRFVVYGFPFHEYYGGAQHDATLFVKIGDNYFPVTSNDQLTYYRCPVQSEYDFSQIVLSFPFTPTEHDKEAMDFRADDVLIRDDVFAKKMKLCMGMASDVINCDFQRRSIVSLPKLSGEFTIISPDFLNANDKYDQILCVSNTTNLLHCAYKQ